MNVQEFTTNDFVHDESGVFILSGHENFSYSDGKASENYLESVFRKAKDLSCNSYELEKNIVDWPSEYHLTKKRSQLLAGFNFNRDSTVLEVGCGCGAITRHLGETFREVVSVEGSLARARLARLRTKDLPNVEILCSPFQKVNFRTKFDIIFCIGVYEYSASFVNSDDPYHEVLLYLNEILKHEGILVIAIENQFGLKYFSSCREDHVGKQYEGLEGYPCEERKVRTFGKVELENRLKRHFSHVQFFYPFPDYKLPDSVLSEEFLLNELSGGLVSQSSSRDYHDQTERIFNESFVALELSKNAALPFFSNSFLVIAGKAPLEKNLFPQLAIHYSSDRVPKFRTRTKVIREVNGGVIASKQLVNGVGEVNEGKLQLSETTSKWVGSNSLQSVIARNCRSGKKTIEEIFFPCKVWIKTLEENVTQDGGVKYLKGEFIDGIWGNFFWDSGQAFFIDKEWTWHERIPMNLLVIRAIYVFLAKDPGCRSFNTNLMGFCTRELIRKIAASLGIHLLEKDFAHFIEVESEIQHSVTGMDKRWIIILLKWDLLNLDSRLWAMKLKRSFLHKALRGKNFIVKLLGLS